jgi:hypothetical protein
VELQLSCRRQDGWIFPNEAALAGPGLEGVQLVAYPGGNTLPDRMQRLAHALCVRCAERRFAAVR